MKLLCLTDLHGAERSLHRILMQAGSVELVLLGGDLTNFGTPNQAEILVNLTRGYCPLVYAVAGNCDSPDIDQRLIDLGVSLFGRSVNHQGIGFLGVSAMPPWHGQMYELTEEEIAKALQSGVEQVGKAERSVVLSHAPPRGCRLDLTRSGQHVGSSALRRFIDEHQPALVFCGHIHEARGMDSIGLTTVVNCGTAFDGYYAMADIAEKIEVSLHKI
jgi:Icc-related predicted phosphoesterase